MPKNRKKIVCLGGGNAMPKTILAGLKKKPVALSVICAMLDSGGSAGREREIYKTNISFGDIRRVFLALSEASQDTKDAFAIRFKNGPYKGMVMANVVGTAMVTAGIDYERIFKVYREILRVPEHYEIFPSTLDNATLCAILENGQIIKGETYIDIPRHNSKVKSVYLEPEAKVYPKAIRAIERAELIVIGPGDLYSSLIQILLVKGIPEAINKSRAKKVYVCNILTKKGETDGFSVLDFTNEIEKYLKGKVDFVVYNKEQNSPLAEWVKIDSSLKEGKFIGANLLKTGTVEHDPDKLAEIILNF